MRAIYAVHLRKIADIKTEEEEAIYDSAETLDSNLELFLSEDFFTDPDLTEDRKELEDRVTPETLKVLKELAERSESFVIC